MHVDFVCIHCKIKPRWSHAVVVFLFFTVRTINCNNSKTDNCPVGYTIAQTHTRSVFIQQGWGACGWSLRAEKRRAEPGRASPAQQPAARHNAACSASRPGYTPSSPGSAAKTCWHWDDCTQRFRGKTAVTCCCFCFVFYMQTVLKKNFKKTTCVASTYSQTERSSGLNLQLIFWLLSAMFRY